MDIQTFEVHSLFIRQIPKTKTVHLKKKTKKSDSELGTA